MSDIPAQLSEPMTLMRTKDVKHLADRIEELERMLGLADDQRAEWERHCKAAEAKLAKVIAAYRAEAMRRDDYTHEAFDLHIASLQGDKT